MTMQAMNSAEWEHATDVARQVCARVFRDGGAPSDALEAFGLAHEDLHGNWRMSVERIATALCRSGTAKKQPQAFKMAA